MKVDYVTYPSEFYKACQLRDIEPQEGREMIRITIDPGYATLWISTKMKIPDEKAVVNPGLPVTLDTPLASILYNTVNEDDISGLEDVIGPYEGTGWGIDYKKLEAVLYDYIHSQRDNIMTILS
ncbi:hypothetical protein COY07_01115 [Candidatus Peregrinibacteria bacterium CG_4_10_14_0_2_um_filter_43_11]|nr:MAG: hypothetical protein COY07_01115 [Candidatus Peregrinibacteria bacterium CG_4_10_14_0_2_um_filter_43_11]